jgi:hypothetical protein
MPHPSPEQDPRRNTIARQVSGRFGGQGREVSQEQAICEIGALEGFVAGFGTCLEGELFGEGGAEGRGGDGLPVSIVGGGSYGEELVQVIVRFEHD